MAIESLLSIPKSIPDVELAPMRNLTMLRILLLLAFPSHLAAQQSRPPNIVIILADDEDYKSPIRTQDREKTSSFTGIRHLS